ncbi:MAG: hypothetical protein QOH57_5080 [Mycobacterium sp.]|nr:hypothetical protein [Mycobacterium sp.]
MSQLTRFVAASTATGFAIASAVVLTGTGTAVADGGKIVPLSYRLRTCDGVATNPYTPSSGNGTAYAVISRSGSTVTAEVHMANVAPDIWYGVRLVETPRPGISCGAGDAGVGMGRLYTDGAGVGTTTVTAPVMSGANGAWVSVEGPLGNHTQLSGDFRTSDYVVRL